MALATQLDMNQWSTYVTYNDAPLPQGVGEVVDEEQLVISRNVFQWTKFAATHPDASPVVWMAWDSVSPQPLLSRAPTDLTSEQRTANVERMRVLGGVKANREYDAMTGLLVVPTDEGLVVSRSYRDTNGGIRNITDAVYEVNAPTAEESVTRLVGRTITYGLLQQASGQLHVFQHRLFVQD